MSDAPLLFNPDDFASIQLFIALSNLTSGSELSETSGVEMMSFEERGAVIEIPPRFCATGHQLRLKIRAVPPKGDTLQFEATGKAQEVVHISEVADEIHLTLVQFSEDEWKNVQALYNKRQDDITAFFESVKGY